MKLSNAIGSTLISLTAITSCFAGPYDHIYESACLSSALIARLHEDGVARRTQESAGLCELHAYVTSQAEHYEGDLKEKVLAGLNKDLADFTTLHETYESGSTASNGLRFQIKSSKMHLGVKAALDLADSSFDDIISGMLPKGYAIDAYSSITHGDEDHIFTSIRGHALKHLLVRTALVLSGATSLEDLHNPTGLSLTTSPWIQPTPLPDDFAETGIEGSPYISGPNLNVIHNGYTYGGDRRVPEHPFPGHDCSSLVTKYTGIPDGVTITTWHQATQYQLHHGLIFHDDTDVVAKWGTDRPKFENHEDFVAMNSRLTPVKVFDIDSTKPGSVYAFKRFPEPSLYGGGGHTAFVLGFEGHGPDAEVITLGTARDLEGSGTDFSYGIQAFPAMSDVRESGVFRMYFDVSQE